MNENIAKTKSLVIDRYWNIGIDSDYSARSVFGGSLVRFPCNKLDTDIMMLVNEGNLTDLEISKFIQEHKHDIDTRLAKSISGFSAFFDRYSGKEAVIAMCLFGPGDLDSELSAKLDSMLTWYSADQRTSWAQMHGSIVGHADIPTGMEALKLFLSGVVVTGALWDLTKAAITDLLHRAREMAYSSVLDDSSELHQRISLLELSSSEIEVISNHWLSNFQRYVLNLPVEEQRVIHRLSTDGSDAIQITNAASESLRGKGYICTVERTPDVIHSILFPKWVRFIEARHKNKFHRRSYLPWLICGTN